MAQEIKWFELTHWDGAIATRSTLEQTARQRNGAVESQSQQLDLRRELTLRSSSYIYHPNLLAIDLSGGATLRSLYNDRDGLSRDSTTGRLNINGRISMLREKPYRGDVYFERSNPTVNVGFADSSVATNSTVGIRVDLLTPFTPIPASVEVAQRTNDVDGFQRSSEQTTEQFDLRLSRALDNWGNVFVSAQSVRTNARAISPGAPLHASRIAVDNFHVDARASFGAAQRHQLNSSADLERSRINSTSVALAPRQSARVRATLRTRHAQTLRTTTRVQSSLVDQGNLGADAHRLSINLDWTPNDIWSVGAASRGSISNSADRELSILDVNASTRMRQMTNMGTLSLNVAGGFQRQDQRADNTVRVVRGSSRTLTGLEETTLGVLHVIPGSVVVQNATRTVTYAEGVDYAISSLGLETSIRRVLGTAISDAEAVLVDCRADSGGTFVAHQYRASARLTLRVNQWLQTTLSHSEVIGRAVSGQPLVEPRNTRITAVGVRGEYLLGTPWGVRIGGRHDSELRQDHDGWFVTHKSEVFVRSSVPWLDATTLRVGARRTIRTTQSVKLGSDTDQLVLDVSLRGRPYRGVKVTASGNFAQDRGARNQRSRFAAGLRASWRYRKFTLTGDIRHVREQQGNVEQSRMFGEVLLRRDL